MPEHHHGAKYRVESVEVDGRELGSGTSEVQDVVQDVVVTRAFMPPGEWGIWALCYMQVCAYGEVPPELVEERANQLNSTGGNLTWRITHEGPDGSDLSPVSCDRDPARIHYMLSY